MPEILDFYLNQIQDSKNRQVLRQAGLVQGHAVGYAIARGETIAVTASLGVTTGLSTVVGFAVSAVGDTATKANAAIAVTGKLNATAGQLDLYRWKHTGASTVTLVAATTAGTVSWVAVGTKI